MRGKCAQISSIVESSPRYRFNWRLRRATALSSLTRLRKQTVDDNCTYRCARYLRRERYYQATSVSEDVRTRRLAQWDNDIHVVMRIIRDPVFRPLKRDLMLRILSQQTEFQIEAATELSSTVVGLFHDLSFSVRPVLPYRELTLGKILGKNFLRPLSELPLQQVQMVMAYELGSQYVSLVLSLGESAGDGFERSKSAATRRMQFWQQQRTKLAASMTPHDIEPNLLERLLKLRVA